MQCKGTKQGILKNGLGVKSQIRSMRNVYIKLLVILSLYEVLQTALPLQHTHRLCDVLIHCIVSLWRADVSVV